MTTDTKKHERKLAKIEAKRASFVRSPFWFTANNITITVLKILFQVIFWSLVVQCTCDGCIWEPIK